jgi:hypothetical protein
VPLLVLGIPSDDPRLVEGKGVLRNTAGREVNGIVAKTRYAREHTLALEADLQRKHTVDGEEESADELLKFTTGELLDNFLDLLKKIDKHFGEDIINSEDRAKAAELRREIGNDKKSYWYRLLHLAKPLVPKWCLATVMEVVATGILDPMFRFGYS